MPNPQNLKPWKPGKAVYSEWLKGLTDAEYQLHLEERRARKSMKNAWKNVVEHNKTKWITDMNNALAVGMEKALATGDVDQIKKIAELLNITSKDDNVSIDINSSEVVNAIKDLTGKLPD